MPDTTDCECPSKWPYGGPCPWCKERDNTDLLIAVDMVKAAFDKAVVEGKPSADIYCDYLDVLEFKKARGL